ncbi:MAG: hypothetical protein ACETV0_06490 [Nitrososphaeria archaeon]
MQRAVSYPEPTGTNLKRRLRDLQSLGVEELVFIRRSPGDGVPVLGKGHKGMVMLGHLGGKEVAVKILRTDASRDSLEHEAEILKRVNALGVGPRLLAQGELTIAMGRVMGEPVKEWIGDLEKMESEKLKTMLVQVMHDCRTMDKEGIDHGELSRAGKHIIVRHDGRPTIIDFETASINRRPSNVTSVCSYFLVGGQPSRKVREILDLDAPPLAAIKSYKRCFDDRSYRQLLTAANLTGRRTHRR